MESTKTFYKNFLTILSGNTVSQLIPFILAPILGRLFDPTDFAVYSNFLAIASLFGIVSAGRLELAIPMAKHHTQAQNLAFSAFVILLVVTGLGFGVYIFSDEVIAYYQDDRVLGSFLLLIPAAIFSIGSLSLMNYWLVRQGKYRAISLSKIIQSLSNNGLAALFGYLQWGPAGLIGGWLFGQYLGVLWMVLAANFGFKRKTYARQDFSTTLKDFRDFPLINSLHAFTDVFATQFLLFSILSIGFGDATLGYFAVMNKYVRAPIGLVASSISPIFYRDLSRHVQQQEPTTQTLLRTVKTSLLFALPFLLIVGILGPWGFSWYLGDKWETSGEFARYMLPIFFMMFVVSPISSAPLVFGKQKTAFALSLLCYGLSLGMLFLGYTFNWGIATSLLLYALSFALILIVTFMWYFWMIRRHDKLL